VPGKKVDAKLAVLREIRDELKEHRGILQHHGELLADHSDRLAAIERRQVESGTRLATELISVAQAVQQVGDLLKDRLDDRDRIADLERRVHALELRVPPAAE
jgi:hypothetical protein